MRYSNRFRTREHAYHSVSLHLAEHLPTYRPLLSSHDVSLAPRLDEETLARLQAGGYPVAAVRRALRASRPQPAAASLAHLTRTLAQLESMLSTGTHRPEQA